MDGKIISEKVVRHIMGEKGLEVYHKSALDRGCHYRWPGWIERVEKARLTRSMSKKGCSPDNSACEGFFGRLKNVMFYCHSWEDISIDGFVQELDRYIYVGIMRNISKCHLGQ